MRKSGGMGPVGGPVYYVCMGAALVLATQILVAWDQTVGASHWWEIVSAVGTAAAALVALRLGVRQGAWRELDRMRDAEIMLTAINPEAERLLQRVLVAQGTIEDMRSRTLGMARPYERLKYTRLVLDKDALKITMTVFVGSLTRLPKQKGNALARCIGQLELLRQDFLSLAMMEVHAPISEEDLDVAGQAFVRIVSMVDDLLLLIDRTKADLPELANRLVESIEVDNEPHLLRSFHQDSNPPSTGQ